MIEKIEGFVISHIALIVLVVALAWLAVPVLDWYQGLTGIRTCEEATSQFNDTLKASVSQCSDKFNTLVDMQTKLEGCEAGVTALEEELVASVDVCAVSAVSMTFKEHRFLACMDSCLHDKNMPKHAIVNDWMKVCWEQCIPMEGAKG
jgi:hypothetical protein